MGKIKALSLNKAGPPPLMTREVRRRLLFAPIGTRYIGGKSSGGVTLDNEASQRLKAQGTNSYIDRFQRGED